MPAKDEQPDFKRGNASGPKTRRRAERACQERTVQDAPESSGAHDVTVTVHKHVPYSISHDFVEEEAEVTTFLDRDSESPGEVFLYKSSCLVPVILLDEETYVEKCQLEDEKMKVRNSLVTDKKK